MRAAVLILLGTSLVAAQEFGALAKATQSLRTALEADLPDDASKALRAIEQQYPFGDTRAQKNAVAAVGKAARSAEVPVRHGAFRTLAALRAPGSSRYLDRRWLDPPAVLRGPVPPSCLEAIRTVGAIADRASLPTLRKLARHSDVTIAETAILALGGYRRLPTPQRKRLAFGLVDQLRQVSLEPPMPRKGKPSTKKQGTKGQGKAKEARTAKERVQLAAAMVKALQALTGQKHRALDAWIKWRERAERLRDPF